MFNEKRFIDDPKNYLSAVKNKCRIQMLHRLRSIHKKMLKSVVDQHASLKTKFIRGTYGPFVKTELCKNCQDL